MISAASVLHRSQDPILADGVNESMRMRMRNTL